MNTRFSALTALVLVFSNNIPVYSANKPPVVGKEAQAQCEEIKIEMCRNPVLPYNYTSYPNLVDNENQEEARQQLVTFNHLIKSKCSTQLQFFLCSVYVPMCTPKVRISIGPCRPLCERVRSSCEWVLSEFGVPWPVSLNCSKFPLENSVESMCMNPDPDEGESRSLVPRDDIPGIPYYPRVTAPVLCKG